MISPSMMDRFAGWISPAWELKRLQARQQISALNGGYIGGRKSRERLGGWSTATNADADADIVPDLPDMRANSRDLIRNNPIGAGAVGLKTTHVVGTGLKLHAKIDRDFLGLSEDEADEWEDTAEREFGLWANNAACDIEHTLTFAGHQDLVFRSTLANGDHFVILTAKQRPGVIYDMALQHIEADRCLNEGRAADTRTRVAGVRLDADGEPVAYDFAQFHPGSRRSFNNQWRTVRAFGENTGRRVVLHTFFKVRSGQTRGVPDLAPVIEAIKQLGRYTEAEVSAAVNNAIVALLVKTQTGDGLAGLNLDEWTTARREYYKESPIEFKGGSSVALGLFPDDDIESFKNERPNTAFDPFIQSLLRLVGMALEIPYEVLIQHFSASWSASQAALMQLWRYVVGRRAWLATHFCQPVYESFLLQAIARGRLAAPGFIQDPAVAAAYSAAEWIGDAKGHINEVQQVDAAIKRVEGGISNLKRETAAITGASWEQVQRQRRKEMRQAPDLPTSSRNTNPGLSDSGDDDNELEEVERRRNAS